MLDSCWKGLPPEFVRLEVLLRKPEQFDPLIRGAARDLEPNTRKQPKSEIPAPLINSEPETLNPEPPKLLNR